MLLNNAFTAAIKMKEDHAEHERQIDYIEFPATDLPAVKEFYHGVFGWDFTDWGEGYTSFRDGRLNGGFARVEQMPASVAPLVVIYSAQLEVIEDEIKEHGGRITKETYSFPGGRRFHFKDPAGNQLAVWSDR
jgi:uncharacterized protein